MTTIFHITQLTEWNAAKSSGEYSLDSLANEGFIHASRDIEQALGVANHRFTGSPDVLVLLEIDNSLLKSPVRYEPGENGDIYPHIYGPINIESVIRVHPLYTDDLGKFFISADQSQD